MAWEPTSWGIVFIIYVNDELYKTYWANPTNEASLSSILETNVWLDLSEYKSKIDIYIPTNMTTLVLDDTITPKSLSAYSDWVDDFDDFQVNVYLTKNEPNPTISQIFIDWVTYDLKDKNAGGSEKRIDVSFSSQSTKTVSDSFVTAATVAMWTFEWTLNWYVQMEVNAWSLKITSSSTETWKFHICLKNNDWNVKSY